MEAVQLNPQHVVLVHYAMVESVARHIHSRLPPSVLVDDLVSVGVLGLMESVERFDPARGVPFETFARHRVRGAILDALRAADWVPHSVRRKAQAIERTRRSLKQRGWETDEKVVAAALGLPVDRYRSMAQDAEIRQVLSLDAPAANDSATLLTDMVRGEDDVAEDTAEAQLRGLVRDAVAQLPERERQAIDLYYFQGLQLKDVGITLGVTESRACQLCGQGIKRLRKRLRETV
jgi:RNA polymerase sigma factor for flagellar operon FliA